MPTDRTEQRKLVAIMFTDMVGYSSLANRDEALGLELLEEHRGIVRSWLPQFDGREVKTTGDGFLIEFSSALQATQCAVEIQKALRKRNQAGPTDRQIFIRIGIHVGDVVLRDGDIHGDGVNIAARLEPLSPPGGVCISEDVARQGQNKLPLAVVAMGPRELKNIQLPVVVYRLVMPWEQSAVKPTARRHRSVVAVFAVLALLASGVWWVFHQHHGSGNVYSGPEIGTVSAVDGFPHDAELQRAWNLLYGVNSTREDFLLAEDMVKNYLAQRVSDPEGVIIYAWINNAFINRHFDVSEERYIQARRYAERANALTPDNPEALAALGQFLSFRRADLKRAEDLLERAIALDPNEPRFYRVLGYNVLNEVKPAEALRFAEETATRFPRDPLVLYDLALQYRDAGEIEKMEQACDRALAAAPVGSAMMLKGWTAVWWHGDVGGLKTWLDQIPEKLRLTDRVIFLRYQYAYLANDVGEALQMLNAFPGDWLHDAYYTGPKALLVGDLLAREGKDALARVQFNAALTGLAREKTRAPTDLTLRRAEIFALIGLNRHEEARGADTLLVSSSEGAYQPTVLNWWFSRIPTQLLLGERQTAVRLIQEAVTKPSIRRQIRIALNVDPRMTPWREEAEISKILDAQAEQK